MQLASIGDEQSPKRKSQVITENRLAVLIPDSEYPRVQPLGQVPIRYSRIKDA